MKAMKQAVEEKHVMKAMAVRNPMKKQAIQSMVVDAKKVKAMKAPKVTKQMMQAMKAKKTVKAMKVERAPLTVSFEDGKFVERRGVVGPVVGIYDVPRGSRSFQEMWKLFKH